MLNSRKRMSASKPRSLMSIICTQSWPSKPNKNLFWPRRKIDLANKVHILGKKMGHWENEMACKETEFSSNTLKDNVTHFYIVGFEAAMEQATFVHPSVDFFELSSTNRYSTGSLLGNLSYFH